MDSIRSILLNLLQNSSKQGQGVIPGNPGEGRGRPGIQDFRAILGSRFRRNDGVNAFCESLY
jgi:hypothetical protein